MVYYVALVVAAVGITAADVVVVSCRGWLGLLCHYWLGGACGSTGGAFGVQINMRFTLNSSWGESTSAQVSPLVNNIIITY